MKFLIAICLLFPIYAFAQTANENSTFSGEYEIVSCKPDCSQIKIDLGDSIIRSVSESKIVSISVLDKLESTWRTCDKKSPFEFNIRLYGPSSNIVIFYNNIDVDPNEWHKICDGTFKTSSKEANLVSSQVKVNLVRQNNAFNLTWMDTRVGLSGEILLKKIGDKI